MTDENKDYGKKTDQNPMKTNPHVDTEEERIAKEKKEKEMVASTNNM